MAKKKPQNNTSTCLINALSHVPKKPLVALSGGCDSLSLLHACKCAGLAPIAAHYNHRWHPMEDDWVKKLRTWCRAHHIPFRTQHATEHTPASETLAREERYRWLLRQVTLAQTSALLTAHHADDQAETLLMRLIRGTSAYGLAGIPQIAERQGVRILRPWLHFSRADIESYAKIHQLDYIHDPFNSPTYSIRGKIRSAIIPALRDISGHDVIHRIARLARQTAEDSQLLDELALGALDDCRDRTCPTRLVTSQLKMLHPALLRRVLAAWLGEQKIDYISGELLEKILPLATTTNPPAKLNLPNAAHIRRREGRLFIDKPPEQQK